MMKSSQPFVYPISGVFDDSSPTLAIEDGNPAPVRITAYRALHVNIRQSDGTEITSFGGGTQYTQGDTDASITGTALMWEEADVMFPAGADNPLPVELFNLVNPPLAATAVKQDTGNSSLSSIDGKITACNTGAVTISALPNEGQQTMANSISVALASDQSPVNVKQARPSSASVDGVTVSTTAVQLITTSYSGVKITNNGVGDLYIGVANTVTTSGATMGLVVYPGGCFALIPGEWEGAVWGIYSVSSGSQNISVYKGVAGA